MSLIQNLETSIVNQIKAQVTPLNTCRGVGDLLTALNPNGTVIAPAVLVVYSGERAKPSETIPRITQETEIQWSCYVFAQSFSSDEEGRLGVYGYIDQLLTALQGFPVAANINSKIEYVSATRSQITSTWVIYEVRFRHPVVRMSAFA
jgi:hypothetical protein